MIGADFRPRRKSTIFTMYNYNKSLVKNAQELRKNMTKEERIIWHDLLKRLPSPVKRQFNIENYIVDFYIPCKKTVIEIDGAQHGREQDLEADKERDAVLENYGITVIRYTNHDIRTNLNGVSIHLLNVLGTCFEELKKQG